MPLAFPSLSHGTLAFGFFNIETDMLLLDQLFFFAHRFCAAVEELGDARGGDSTEGVQLEGWRISERQEIGDLQGAIAGVDHSGFIGATYRVYPFPAAAEDFRQSPEGHRTRERIAELMENHGAPETLSLRRCGREAVELAEFRFSPEQFSGLLAYVDRGGFPRWKEGIRPLYVTRMMKQVSADGWLRDL
jgi:hypothetical protein